MSDAIGRCHGFLGRPDDPYCYHPGPGILPVWASDLLAWAVVLLIAGVFIFTVWRVSKHDLRRRAARIVITLRGWARCRHRSRLLNLPCLRPWVYDYWCGHHNHACWYHTLDFNRCPRRRQAQH